MKKRIISLALVLILAFSLLPTGALAADMKIYDVYQGDGFYITVKPFALKTDKYTIGDQYSPILDGEFHDGMLAVFTADVDENWVNREFIRELNYADKDGNILFPEGIFHEGGFAKYGTTGDLSPSDGMIPYWDGKTVDLNEFPLLGFVDYSGKVVIPCKYNVSTISPFRYGLSNVTTTSLVSSEGNGFIDKSGRLVIDLSESGSVRDDDCFSDGLVSFTKSNGGTVNVGYMDTSGNMVLKLISYNRDDVEEYDNGWEMCAAGKTDGYLLPVPGMSAFHDGYAVCYDLRSGNRRDYNYAIIDTKGNVTGTFSDAQPNFGFHDGLLNVGFIDNRGNSSGYAYVDTSGNVVYRGGSLGYFSCGLMNMSSMGGLVDTKFNIVIPKEHISNIRHFNGNLALGFVSGHQTQNGWVPDQTYVLEKHEGVYTGGGSVYNHAKGGEQTPGTTPTPTQQPTAVTAAPTNDKLTVNGVLQSPTVYKIDGSNYFKIRDLAAVLNGTEKQFDVGYDAALNSVTATTGKGYAKQSGDLAGAAAGGSQTAAPSNDAIYIDGRKIDATVYKINGNNYFKLRDLGQALDFYVGWTQADGVFIDTSKPYEA